MLDWEKFKAVFGQRIKDMVLPAATQPDADVPAEPIAGDGAALQR